MNNAIKKIREECQEMFASNPVNPLEQPEVLKSHQKHVIIFDPNFRF